MNSLKSTANKAFQTASRTGSSKTTDSLPAGVDRRRDVLRTNRSNSVDVANLSVTAAMAAGNSTRNWFKKMSARSTAAVTTTIGPRTTDLECTEQRPAIIGGGGEYVVQKSPVVVTFADERPKVSLLQEPAVCKAEKPSPPLPQPNPVHVVTDCKKSDSKSDDVVMWDRPTGSVVNAEVLGTAIEGFLAAKKSGDSGDASPADSEQKPVAKTTNEPNSRTCDTSICSSLKDLFVK